MLGLHAHLNLTFAHLTALHNRFALIEPKETEVLRDLEVALRLSEDSNPETVEIGEIVGESGEVESKGDRTNGKLLCNLKVLFDWFYVY